MFDLRVYLEKLKRIREVKMITLDSLAREIGISHVTLLRILGDNPGNLYFKTKRLIRDYVDKNERELDGK
jgi:transcriptional regulator with XRE-family HTH domain